ncbi:MAG: prepilin-type N-terminal cleavage/methylation domain-containing protein [Gammaproteobacteria bacterium]
MPTVSNRQRGVTLIELVIYISIVSVALVAVLGIYLTSSRYSADPMIRLRTIELGQSFLEEIILKAYDNNTPNGGGCVTYATGSRCASSDAASAGLQAEPGENRTTFDDVDDYHNISYCGNNVTSADAACTSACQPMLNAAGTSIAGEYAGFAVCIRVAFAGNELNSVAPGTGTTVLANDAKRIDVIVTDHLSSRMVFSAYRTNF